MAIIIETERLNLRTWKEEDLPVFQKMNADPEVMKYFPKKLDREGSDRLAHLIMDFMEKNRYGLWAVEEKKGESFLGFTGFHFADFPADFTPCLEIGWRLKRDAWGRGLATEAASACLRFGFNELELDEVYSFTSQINLPSKRVMEKIGLQFHGTFLHPNIEEGNSLKPHVLYRLNSREYNNL